MVRREMITSAAGFTMNQRIVQANEDINSASDINDI